MKSALIGRLVGVNRTNEEEVIREVSEFVASLPR